MGDENLLIAINGGLIGIDDQSSIRRVQDDHLTILDMIEKVSQSDDCRNFHRTGENCGVAGPPPRGGGKTENSLSIERGSLAGSQIPGNKNRVFLRIS